LEALEQGSADAAKLAAGFELAYLATLGFAPALLRCAACGRKDPPAPGGRAPFSSGAGGRLCPTCADEAKRSGRRVGSLPRRVLQAAAELGGATLEERPLPELQPKEVEKIRDFALRFLEYHLEGRPKSYQRFLAVPNRNAPSVR
jgi:recombinational DNA repair protein (RecF pathway)